jgi:hypothetical protein
MPPARSAPAIPLAAATVLGLACGGNHAHVDAAVVPIDVGNDRPTTSDTRVVEAAPGSIAVKFCNRVELGYPNYPLTLEIGPQPVALTAEFDHCSPPPGEPCATMAGGPLQLVLVDDRDALLGIANLNLLPDRQYLFVLEPDRRGALIQRLAGYLLPPGTSCAGVEVPPSSAGAFSLDGGTPVDGPAGN